MSKNDKPVAEKLGWHVTGVSYPIVTRWLRLRRDMIKMPSSRRIAFTYVVTPDAVGVVPVTDDGKIVLLRQYRYTIDEWSLEIPAGGTHDRRGLPLEQAAEEELHEELGASCKHIDYVNCFHMSIGNSAQRFHVYLATGVELDRAQSTEETEFIEVCPMSAHEAMEAVRSGQVTDCASALAILLCESRIREMGYLES